MKQVVFGGDYTAELVAKWQAILDENAPPPQEERTVEEEHECPECGTKFKDEKTVKPEPPTPVTAKEVREKVVLWMIRPIMDYKPTGRETLESITINHILDEIRLLKDPAKASIEMEDPDYNFLKKLWQTYGKEEVEIHRRGPMGQMETVKVRTGWPSFSEIDQCMWMAAHKILFANLNEHLAEK